MGEIERLICALLRGEPVRAPRGSADQVAAAILECAEVHGVGPLLEDRLSRAAPLPEEAGPVLEALRGEKRARAMHELAARAELAELLAEFAVAGVQPLLLKGAALAYTLYPNPILRPRADTDVLIREGERARAEQVLDGRGFRREEGVAGDYIAYQSSWTRTDRFGAEHRVDLHWRVSNAQMFARLIGYDELASGSGPVPALGPHARTPAFAHALLLACVHRAGHRNSPYFVRGRPHYADRLIWLYDLHLLVGAMANAELAQFVALAEARRLRGVCLDALQRARDCFGTVLPEEVVDRLSRPGAPEPAARYFSGGRLRQMAGDFLSLEGWSARAHWLRELAFPPAAYMRWKYPDRRQAWLPWLYARRGTRGLARLMFAGRSKSGHAL